MRYIPRPRGELKPNLFKIGGLGAFLVGITMLIMGASSTVWDYSNPVTWGKELFVLLTVVNVIGLFLIAVGCYGIYWNYGSQSGLVGIIGMLVMGPFILVIVSSMVATYSSEDVSPSYLFVDSPLGIIFAITMTVVHLSVAHARHYLPIWHGARKILAMARGTNIVGTGFFFSIIWIFIGLGIVGYFIVGIALILFAIFFLSAPMPGNPTAGPQGAPT
jgi:membrane-associated HD superfamily phosphohydrolase